MVTKAQIPGWLQAEYPFSPRRHRLADGTGLSYLDEGPRAHTAVVMVHGNPTWSYYYRHLVRALAPTRRCVVPDHVGMGLSDKPGDRAYTLAQRIADLEHLIASLGLEQVDLVVHDWGGAIGLGFAGRHPEKVRRITILNTAAFSDTRIPARIALCRAPLLGPLIVRGCNGFAWPATWMAMSRRALGAGEKRGYLFPYGSWADRVAVNAFVRDIPMDTAHPSHATLAAVEAGLADLRRREALIVWGGRDFCFNDRFLARWRGFLPEASVHRIADAGHYVLDDAREEVVPRISAFLTRA
jgi:pimeloyl-ACP methyl ester carboxylesterase